MALKVVEETQQELIGLGWQPVKSDPLGIGDYRFRKAFRRMVSRQATRGRPRFRARTPVGHGSVYQVTAERFFPSKMRMRGLLAVAFMILAAQALAQTGGDSIVPVFGKLVAVHDRSITVQTQRGTSSFLITAETHIWRGDYVDVHHLQPGDDLSIRSRVSSRGGEAIAVDIDANIERWNGTITSVSGDRIEIDIQDEGGHFVGRKARLIFWNKTIFLVDNASTRELRVGAYLEVIGLVEKDTLRVWRVIGFDPAGLQKIR